MIRQNCDLTKEEREAHEAKWGKYNDFPPGWHEITMEDYAKCAIHTWDPELIEHRQMLRSAEFEHVGACVSARLEFLQEGRGYAVVRDYWGGVVKFYEFGSIIQGFYEGIDSSD